MVKWIYLFFGGGIGTMARYALSGIICEWFGSRFPLGTLAVNLLGCFLAGFLTVMTDERFFFSPELRTSLFIGFLGGFTTFSALISETANLIKDGQTLLAFSNVLLSVSVGFIVFRLGILLGKVI